MGLRAGGFQSLLGQFYGVRSNSPLPPPLMAVCIAAVPGMPIALVVAVSSHKLVPRESRMELSMRRRVAAEP